MSKEKTGIIIIECKGDNCKLNSTVKGYCNAHYMQHYRHGFTWDIRKFKYMAIDEKNKKQLCTRCEYWLSFDYFKQRYGTRSNERYSICKRCNVYRRYNMNARDYDNMLKSQNYKCFCCDVSSEEKKLQVDHDHSCCKSTRSCGKCVRSLLCNDCNAAIGHLKESIETAKKVVNYLENINGKK